MAGVTKVHGFATPDQFFGRHVVGITVSGLVACPALVDSKLVEWPELEAAIKAIESICTISMIGTFTATDTSLNMIVEGVAFPEGEDHYVLADGTTAATLFEKLDELVGLVTVGGAVAVFEI